MNLNFTEKSLWAMRLIFTLEATSISIIVAFGARKIQKWLLRSLYPQRVTVWCGFWAEENIGHNFFENEAIATVSVNGLCYRTMINEFLRPELEDIDMDDVYFQQDGATCQSRAGTIGLLRKMFSGQVISQNGDYNWPLRSCDLTLLDTRFPYKS